MNKNLYFRIDSVQLLTEIADAGLSRNMGVLKVPLNIFRDYLGQVAQRASELDDPKLNIIMLKMGLYEVDIDKIFDLIDEQKSRL